MFHLIFNNQLERGGEGAEVALLRHYLRVCGFHPPDDNAVVKTTFDEDLEESIKSFQKAYNLPIDGRLNEETLNLIRTPRCGVSDHPGLTFDVRSNPVCGWRRRDLRYHIAETLSQIGNDAHISAFTYCLQEATAATGITFTPGPRGSSIQSFTYRGDGSGGTYAYAFFPCSGADSGDIYFDTFDSWSVQTPTPRNRVDFVSVCLHELGHALGLGHSADRNAVMYAYFSFGEMRRRWTQDDLRGLRTLYPSVRSAIENSSDEEVKATETFKD